jgi:hypothetical protein
MNSSPINPNNKRPRSKSLDKMNESTTNKKTALNKNYLFRRDLEATFQRTFKDIEPSIKYISEDSSAAQARKRSASHGVELFQAEKDQLLIVSEEIHQNRLEDFSYLFSDNLTDISFNFSEISIRAFSLDDENV